MKVLLIWDLSPERVDFFLIEDPSEVQIKALEEANGLYINADEENDGLDYLNSALDDFNEEYNNTTHAGVWKDKQVQTPFNGPIDRVFNAGFAL